MFWSGLFLISVNDRHHDGAAVQFAAWKALLAMWASGYVHLMCSATDIFQHGVIAIIPALL